MEQRIYDCLAISEAIDEVSNTFVMIRKCRRRLGREVQEERPLAHARSSRDLLDCGLIEAMCAEQAQCMLG